MRNSDSYETDFYAWALDQAELLRAGRFSEADMENIAEEIESMGRSQKRELVSRLKVLLAHLLKWQYQPGLRGNSWRLTIVEQRAELVQHLSENPSLKPLLPEALANAYRLALIVAQRETGLPADRFPPSSAWTAEQIISDDFWPDAA